MPCYFVGRFHVLRSISAPLYTAVSGDASMRGGAIATGGHLQGRHFDPVTGEQIITKIALIRSTLSSQKSLNVVWQPRSARTRLRAF